MSEIREVTFRITERKEPDNYVVLVQPSLEGITCEDGGDRILLSIAVNCVRMVAKRTGLEAAVDQFNNLVINRTRMERR